MTAQLRSMIDKIVAIRGCVPPVRAALISITGIDASGKGYLTAKVAEALQSQGIRVANLNINGWLNLPPRKFHFARDNPRRTASDVIENDPRLFS